MKTKARKPAPRRTKIFIVDDHPRMREGLAQLIAQEKDLVVCGEAEDAAGAWQQIEQLQPDLALVDITLRTTNGLELIKDLRLRVPGLAVLVISMHEESLYAERALKAGASGYVMKSEGGAKILQAIRHVLAGGVHVSEKMSARILKNLYSKPAAGTGGSVDSLSDRELEIFRLIARGIATKVIGSQLHLSPKTVETHRMNIKAKLGIETAAELISYAARWTSGAESSENHSGRAQENP